MSVQIPVVAVVFGSVSVPQGDVIELRVSLGCTKEVGSFECLLQNWDKKYSPGSADEIVEGVDGSIAIGRVGSCPQVATVRVEEVEYLSSSVENYVRVRGRCWGERLFRRVVTKTYVNMKGEDIVKDLIDNYVGLSHVRDSVELIESTDTTYALLEYKEAKVFDILKYIAETADKNGVIGFDFRVAPDGKFEFFPRNSKTNNVDLTEAIEYSSYSKDISRVRNRIYVYGAAEKATPSDKDANTEDITKTNGSVDAPDGTWTSGTGQGNVYVGTEAIVGSKSLEHRTENHDYWGCAVFTYDSGKKIDANKFPSLTFQIKLEKDRNFAGDVKVVLEDTAGSQVWREGSVSPDKWYVQSFAAGKLNSDQWTHSLFNSQPFDWENVKKIYIYAYFGAGAGTGSFWIDNLFWNHCRWEAIEEDSVSQSEYGLRELVEVDEELHSDNECSLRGKALLAQLKDPAEFLAIRSTVVDYGSDPILAGEKVHVVIPNENVDAYFRVISAEYHVRADNQTLQVTLELGREKALLADYLYGLRATTVTVEHLMRTKAGLRGAVGGGGGGGGGGVVPDWISPTYIGPRSDAPAITNFRTKNVSGDSAVNHQFNPTDDAFGVLGVQSKRWNEAHLMYLFVSGFARLNQLNIGGYEGDQVVITPGRVLQNVFADASIITSGQFELGRMPRGDAGKFLRAYGADYDPMYAFIDVADIPGLPASKITSGQFPLARLPRGTAGYVLEAQGAAYDPMYVNPHGRYYPASHTHSAVDIASGVLSEDRIPDVFTKQMTFQAGIVTNSVNCANWQLQDAIFENDFRITEAEKLGLGEGLAFLNPKGRVLMVLDGEGNLSIAGKIKQLMKAKRGEAA